MITLSVGLVSTKLTVVAFGTKPDPVIVIDVWPVMEPDEGLTAVTVGTNGDQTKLLTVIPVPQYTAHCPEFGALTPAG